MVKPDASHGKEKLLEYPNYGLFLKIKILQNSVWLINANFFVITIEMVSPNVAKARADIKKPLTKPSPAN